MSKNVNCRYLRSGFCQGPETGKRCNPNGCNRRETGEQVHVYSWPLARAFTFDEWCDYLKVHEGDSSDVVAEFGGWQFNVAGVCLNRKKAIEEYIGRTGAKFSVEVYQAPKGHILGAPLAWNFSASYSTNNGGGTAGWGEIDGDEQDATIAGLKKVAESFFRDEEWYRKAGKEGEMEACRIAGNKALDMILDIAQLTLF